MNLFWLVLLIIAAAVLLALAAAATGAVVAIAVGLTLDLVNPGRKRASQVLAPSAACTWCGNTLSAQPQDCTCTTPCTAAWCRHDKTNTMTIPAYREHQ